MTTANARAITLADFPFVWTHGVEMGSQPYFIADEMERLRRINAPWTAWAHRMAGWDDVPHAHYFDLALAKGERRGAGLGTSAAKAERSIRLALSSSLMISRAADIRALAASLNIDIGDIA